MDSVTRKKRRSLSADDNFTPRTLIQGFLQTAQTVRQSPRKRARVTPSSTRTPTADLLSAQQRRSRTPRTLPKSAQSGRHQSTRPEILATPGGSNPTPRGLITGFLKAADIRTPAVHVGTRRSSPLKQPTPAIHRSVLQARAESTNSSSIESPIDDALSRFARPQPREGRGRRQRAINREEFAARMRDRMGQEERDERTEEDEMESSRDATVNRTELDSIVEEAHNVSLPRPDSTTKDTSDVQAPVSGGSRRRSRSRRSFLENSSFQVPSTSTGVDVRAQDSSVAERRASHPSASSIEDESAMDQATQETIQARLSSNTDPEDEREEQSRRDGEEEEGMERLERTPGGRKAVAAMAAEVDDQEEKGEEEEEMDLDDDDFDEDNLIAPTQPAQLESIKKRSRSDMASPLHTPRLRGAGRHPTPKAKTPAPFREAAHRQLPLHLRSIPKKPPSGRSRGTKEPPSTLPKSLTRSIFSHFSKARVSRNALAAVDEVSSKYFKNISKDLLAYCKHAGRSTIERADIELLMKRQRLVSDKEPLPSLIEKYLPMEYREELIPMARSGNKVYPKMPKK